MAGEMEWETTTSIGDLIHIFKLIFFTQDADFIEDLSYIRINLQHDIIYHAVFICIKLYTILWTRTYHVTITGYYIFILQSIL